MSQQISIEWIERHKEFSRLGIDLSPEMHDRIRKFCKSSGISQADFARLALSQLLNRMGAE